MRLSQLKKIALYSEMLLGNDLDNFHNFFHQLLVLWINHVVLSLMSQLVLSFVSTSSTVFVFPQVLRSQSDVAGVSLLIPKLLTRASSASKLRIVNRIHHCLQLHCAISGFNRPIIDSLRIFQTCNRPTNDFQIRMIDQSSTHFQISPTHSQTHSTRLPGSERIALSLDI